MGMNICTYQLTLMNFGYHTMERSSTNLYFVWRYFNVFHMCSDKGDEFRDFSSTHRRSKKGCQEMCHPEKSHGHATLHRDYIWPISYWDDSDDHTPCIPCIVIYRLRYISPLVDQLTCTFYSHVLISTNGKYSFSMGNTICYFRFFEFQVPTVKTREEIEIFPTTLQ